MKTTKHTNSLLGKSDLHRYFTRNQKMWIILLIVICPINSFSQTKVEIDGLFYNLTGAFASVANNSSVNYPGNCKYTNYSYTIPSSVSYNGMDYTVNEIGKLAFGPYNTDWNSKGSSAFSIILPNTIKYIREYAFYGCENLSSIMIPASVESFEIGYEYNPFENCKTLREIIYLPQVAPSGWVAAGTTYVPDKKSYINPSFSINYANVIEMITFEQTEFEYTGLAPTTTWKNNVNGYSATLNMPTLSVGAGEYEEWIPVTFTKGEESFTANVAYRYIIKPAKLTATVMNAIREYGEENPQFTVTYQGFLNGENESVITTNPSVTTIATKTSNVGEYPITINNGSATNYEIVYEPGVLTVTKAPLSAKVHDETKQYGTQNPSFTIDYYGLKNDETVPAWHTRPIFQTEATQSSGVGEYEVGAVNGVPVNYDLGTITTGTLSITPAPLIIKANDATRQYYTDDLNYSYTCNGFVNGDNESVLSSIPMLSTSASLNSNVGTYEIIVSNASSPNYDISYVNGTLTITPRMLMASVGNYERIYNEDNPAFEVKYDGFVGNEDEKVLNEKPTANTIATKTSDVGIYPINVTGGSADNYKFSYTPGTLTINKAEQTIIWEQDLTNLNVGDQVELKAEASSGLPLTYTMDYNNAAEIYLAGTKTYLDCKAGGQFRIQAVQNGNKNYYSSPRATNTVSIIGSNPPSDPTLTIKQADNGTVNMQVSMGSVYTFTIIPDTGWKIHSVMYNNMDVTNQLSSDGRFTTPTINNNCTLSVVYEQNNNPVSAIDTSETKIMVTTKGIRVVDANIGDIIRVYTKDGVLQHSVKVNNQSIDIPLTKSDVYIVKVGEKTLKLGY